MGLLQGEGHGGGTLELVLNRGIRNKTFRLSTAAENFLRRFHGLDSRDGVRIDIRTSAIDPRRFAIKYDDGGPLKLPIGNRNISGGGLSRRLKKWPAENEQSVHITLETDAERGLLIGEWPPGYF